MTEQTDPYAHHLEMSQRRDAWFAEKKRKAEEAERAAKQAELEAYLRRRAEEWEASTGSTDGLSQMLPRWREQFIESKVSQQEAERQRKLDEAAAQYPY